MRIAALYDIHANLPALDAVLEEVAREGVNLILVGGDVLPGPLPAETLARLLSLPIPVQFIHGNGELAVLAQMAALESGRVTYWGTSSGKPLPEPLRVAYRWTAQQLKQDYEQVLRGWPKTLTLQVGGLGRVLFCHGTPHSETQIFTRLTPEERLRPLFEGLGVSTVVCGHTHMQFDRTVGGVRVVNAGTVGEPFGEPVASWLRLGPDIQMRHTSYDFQKAAEQMRACPYPQAEESARGILSPPPESEMLRIFGQAELL